jgi:hypothetical protein
MLLEKPRRRRRRLSAVSIASIYFARPCGEFSLSLSSVFATTHIYLLAGEPLNSLKSASFVIALAALFFFIVRQQDQFRNASCISTSSSSL